MSAAARLDDPIEHTGSLTGLVAGLAVGAIGAALIVGTGGLAAVAIVGATAAAGAGIGQLIGSFSYFNHAVGQIVSGSGNVHVNGKPAARAHLDKADCSEHGSAPQILAQGSSTVHINGEPAARVGDHTVCDAKISSGSGNVFIGGGTDTTDPINPEVPAWLERAVLVVGLASAFVLASPVIVIAGFAGGVAGGFAGNWAGGELFGEGSDEQKVMAFGGALLGGGLGAKGGKWFDARYEFKVQGVGSNLANVKVAPKTVTGKSADLNPLGYARNAKYFYKDPIQWSASRPSGTELNYKIYQRKDIDWSKIRNAGDKRFVGKTNLEAASKGLSPQLADGNFATLHHMGQKSPGPLVEGSTRYHGVGKPGQGALHSQYGRNKPHPELQPDRKKFDVDTREYWQWRAIN
jgi:uncharacterized Zn-binding protein involved in type VI secretion